jgi:hypothetical protein
MSNANNSTSIRLPKISKRASRYAHETERQGIELFHCVKLGRIHPASGIPEHPRRFWYTIALIGLHTITIQMKPYTEKYHYCRYCKSYTDRLYIRTRKLESMSRHNKEKRGFEAIGWYCKKCKMFETDEMIRRQHKESIKDSLGIKSDEEYNDFQINFYR